MIKEIKYKRLKETIEKEFSISLNTLKYVGVAFTLGDGIKITIDCNIFKAIITEEMEDFCTDVIMQFIERKKYKYKHIELFYTR